MDWSELNLDLLRRIAKKVTDISDFVRLRAVCKQWRSAVHPSDLPPQLPYFIKCIRNNNSNSSCDFQFRPLYSDKTHNLTVRIFSELEELPNLYGSFTEFVLLLCSKAPFSGLLLNPLTGFQAPLPIEYKNYCYPLYFGPSCSHEPNLVENSIDLVGIVDEFEPPNDNVLEKVILWRYTDSKWRRITEIRCSYDEVVLSYSSGKIYVRSHEIRYIRVIDVTNGNTVSLLPEVSESFCYIVEACHDLIGVKPFFKPEGLNMHEVDFLYELYLLKNSGTNPCWAKVNDIGDWMLFFNNQRNWLCLKASDFEGCKNNCIYSSSKIDNSVNCYSAPRCDMMESTTRLLLFPYDSNGTWFLPSLC